jgi:hypothetical protein
VIDTGPLGVVDGPTASDQPATTRDYVAAVASHLDNLKFAWSAGVMIRLTLLNGLFASEWGVR